MLKRLPGANPTGDSKSLASSLAGSWSRRKSTKRQKLERTRMKKQNTKRAELVPLSDALEGLEDFFTQHSAQERQGVWAEPQLYLLPFCVPQDRTAERFRQIRISESVTVNNEITQRSFLVIPHPDLGLPGSFELEVMTGIYRLADIELKKHGFVPEFIELGTFRSFLEAIGRTGGGKYIGMLKEALRRLAGTTCISEGFFYSKPRNLYVVDSFTFITSLQIAGETDFNGGTFDRTRVKLHEFIRENLNNNFRTLIDFDYLRTLRTDIAKSLALHIAYRVFKNGKSEWIGDYDWLADRIAIKVHADLKRAKDQLKAACLDLRDTGLIESWEWLPGRKIKFNAGRRLLEMHRQRVQAKDAWIAHEQETVRKERLITSQAPRTAQEAKRQDVFDPLAGLCAEFAFRGWTAIAHKAHSRGLTEESLTTEALKRGHSLQQTVPL
jgi:hypothetical protein